MTKISHRLDKKKIISIQVKDKRWSHISIWIRHFKWKQKMESRVYVQSERYHTIVKIYGVVFSQTLFASEQNIWRVVILKLLYHNYDNQLVHNYSHPFKSLFDNKLSYTHSRILRWLADETEKLEDQSLPIKVVVVDMSRKKTDQIESKHSQYIYASVVKN